MKKLLFSKYTLLITFITFFVWHGIVSTGFFGEGYYYFDRGQDFLSPNGTIANPLIEYDIFARITFDILPPIFGDTIPLYLVFQLLCMVLLNITLFYTVEKITKNKFLSFIITIFFATNYMGLFEMLGTGNYQRFVQRVPQNVLILLSFLNLHYFLLNKNRKNFLLSVTFFSVAVMLGHYASFTMPIFFVYPFLWVIINKQKLRQLIYNFGYSLSYLLTNYFIIHQGPHYPHNDLGLFLSNWQQHLEKIILQIANITLPYSLIERIAAVASPFNSAIVAATIPIIILHFLGYFYVKKKLPKLTLIYLACLLLIPIFLFINLYFEKVDPIYNMRGYNYYFLPQHYLSDLITVRGDRYYFFPVMLFSILWGILLYAFFSTKQFAKMAFTLIIVIYLAYNTQLIWLGNKELQKAAEDTNSYLSYIKTISPNFNDNTVIVTTRFFLWPSTLIRDTYKYPNLSFTELKSGWDTNLTEEQRKNAIVIDFDHKKRTLIDKTTSYRQNNNVKIESN